MKIQRLIVLILRTKESICVTNTRYSVIPNVSKSMGFKIVKDMKLWNILWTDSMPGVEVYKNMKRFQQINHFPGMIEICRKDLLSRNLNRMLKLYPYDYDIFPKTWIFPADLGAAIAYSKTRKQKTFILKPDHCAQGRGIWLTNDLNNINPDDRMICQLYIHKPLLIDGFKFDLRVYTLITSVDPLRIFVYNEGLARFATNMYRTPSPNNVTDLFMHLTNYAVNKHSTEFSKCEEMGSKRNFKTINRLLAEKGCDVKKLWQDIDDIIIKTILSAWPMLKHNYHACFPMHDTIQACFEILGFDILMDSKLKPYILEVNHSPSFHTNQSVDYAVKEALIRDTFALIGTRLVDKRQIMKEDRKRARKRLFKKQETESDHHKSSHEEEHQKLSPLAQQIAWEESHLGDFRRIMPPQSSGEFNKYCQFFDLQNQASIYSDTVASKRREDVAKKLRLALKLKQDKILQPTPLKNKSVVKRILSKSFIDRMRMKNMKRYENWGPSFISETEERLRCIGMEDRSKNIAESNLLEMIFQLFYYLENLNESDIKKYPHFYRKLQEQKLIYEPCD
ncbi:tubulin polyglutamylase TTLL13 isoform X2 [Episyrphus balteatus]|uniref:tubulin polyglutamylase TTLL13 isoform X2 n=1 Tax=Episyrphus balteatus TaxID=286459 RepID=UPI002484EE9D|nr:tubulin polyglutamylase TTLL13 isoform X2 [Episyrphus balteatus]